MDLSRSPDSPADQPVLPKHTGDLSIEATSASVRSSVHSLSSDSDGVSGHAEHLTTNALKEVVKGFDLQIAAAKAEGNEETVQSLRTLHGRAMERLSLSYLRDVEMQLALPVPDMASCEKYMQSAFSFARLLAGDVHRNDRAITALQEWQMRMRKEQTAGASQMVALYAKNMNGEFKKDLPDLGMLKQWVMIIGGFLPEFLRLLASLYQKGLRQYCRYFFREIDKKLEMHPVDWNRIDRFFAQVDRVFPELVHPAAIEKELTVLRERVGSIQL